MNERELLQRVVTAWEDDRFELIEAMYFVVRDIQAYLANPPEPVNVYPFCGVVKMPELYQAMYVGEDRISIDPVTGDVGIGSKE